MIFNAFEFMDPVWLVTDGLTIEVMPFGGDFFLSGLHSRNISELSIQEGTSGQPKFQNLPKIEKCIQAVYLGFRDCKQIYSQIQFLQTSTNVTVKSQGCQSEKKWAESKLLDAEYKKRETRVFWKDN